MKVIKTSILPYEMFEGLISEVSVGIYDFDSEEAVFPIDVLDELNNSLQVKEVRQEGITLEFFVVEI